MLPSGKETSGDLVLLGAFCLFLSALDYLIPKPMPFMRIGLANLPLLLALAYPGTESRQPLFSAKNFFLLALLKVLGQALLTGTFVSYVLIFSLAGTAVSSVVMFLLRMAGQRRVSLVGIGLTGAFASNAAQLMLARFLVFGESARYLAPPFLAAGIISGAVLGFFAEAFAARSQWLRFRGSGAPVESPSNGNAAMPETAPAGSTAGDNGFSVKGAVLLLLAVLFLVLPYLPVRAVLFGVFWFLVILKRKKNRHPFQPPRHPFQSPRPFFTLISFTAIVVCNLFPPFGKILFTAGPLLVAEGSLLQGIQRAVTMEALIMFSRLIPGVSLPLPGRLGRLLRESFIILDQLKETNLPVKGKDRKTNMVNFFYSLDTLMCRLSGFPIPAGTGMDTAEMQR
ncbi:membrane protein [Spirochaetia bacterium]|nr:membrane protein [Spirochaetia bacterium]